MRQAAARIERALLRHRDALLLVGWAAAVLLLLGRSLTGAVPPYALQDILINYAGGLVRRGLLGAAAVGLSERIGGEPWAWGWGLAALLSLALFLLAIRIFRRLPGDPALLPLALAPGGLLFFAYDPDGGLRKEFLGYLALVLVLQAPLARSPRAARAWAAAGAAAFLPAVAAHEANLFLLPALLLGLRLAAEAHPGLRAGLAAVAVAAAISSVVLAAYLVRLPSPNPAAICAAARVAECGGPFGWLARSTGDGVAYVLGRRDLVDLPVYGVYAALACLPLLSVRFAARRGGLGQALVLVPCAAVLPLFLLGYDWGRWIQMAVLPASLLLAAAAAAGLGGPRRLLPPWAAVLYLASWSLPHAIAGLHLRAVFLLAALAALVALGAAVRRIGASRR